MKITHMKTIATYLPPEGLIINAPYTPSFQQILTTDALSFLAQLQRRFNTRRKELLLQREQVQQKIDQGWTPEFAEETRTIREGDWQVAPLPYDLLDRRVEITGP